MFYVAKRSLEVNIEKVKGGVKAFLPVLINFSKILLE
jgi:hypothetical protein